VSPLYPFPRRISEGRFADFDIRLSSIPLSNVNLTFSHDAYISLGTNFFHFTPVSWNITQRLRVYAIHDSIVNKVNPSSNLTIKFTSPDYKFNNAITVVTVPIRDIDRGMRPYVIYMLIYLQIRI
jgi:hypothetical protein